MTKPVDLFPGVPITEAEQDAWDRQVQETREAWEEGSRRFSQRFHTVPVDGNATPLARVRF